MRVYRAAAAEASGEIQIWAAVRLALLGRLLLAELS
eukprot:COSAG04_NODE_2905_length_3400_cov_3.600727_3_plen_36_part_00